MMELKDLVGDHEMKWAAMMDARHPQDPDASAVMFFLGDDVYLICEDPSDGYRSHAGSLFKSERSGWEFSRAYINRKVTARWLEKEKPYEDAGYENECEILEIVDRENGHVWLRVGTDNTDDYYSSFISTWNAMPA